jgi:hypothetical protein
MSDTAPSSARTLPVVPIAVAILLLAILGYLFLPSSDAPEPVVPLAVEVPVVETLPEPTPPVVEDVLEVEEFTEVAALPESNVDELAPLTEEFAAPIEVVVEPEPLDISDQAVKQTILTMSRVPMLATLLVNEGVLERTVATVANIADGKLATNQHLLSEPAEPFSVFKQADILYIAPESYARYKPYVEAFSEINTNDLLALYDTYGEELAQRYEQIAPPGQTFDAALINAINELLDTPVLSLPIAVETDRAMYQFANPQLEGLSSPQKQFLRMGPDNMRIAMRKLRDLREALEARQ